MRTTDFYPLKNMHSWKWAFAILSLIIFAVLVLSHFILKSELSLIVLGFFALIAVLSSAFVCVGGSLGYKIYYTVSIISLIIGLLYTLYVAIFNASDGFSDITSILIYIILFSVGIVIGSIAQFSRFLYYKYKYK